MIEGRHLRLQVIEDVSLGTAFLLAPARQMFDILVATVFADEIIEMIPIKERC